jgi:hypothetical protein
MNLIVKSAVRIIVVLTAIQSISYIIKYISSLFNPIYQMSSHDKSTGLLALLLAVLVLYAILSIIWIKAARIARILIGRVDVNTLTINSSSLDVFWVGVGLIGVILLATSLPSFFELIAQRIVYSSGQFAINDISSWVGTISKLIIGVCLTLGLKKIPTNFSAILKRIVTDDAKPKEEN